MMSQNLAVLTRRAVIPRHGRRLWFRLTEEWPKRDPVQLGGAAMSSLTTRDGTEIFYKDWGSGQAIVFSHGWPLSADDWDTQMLFFLHHGYRVIAHDRRGHGRSAQTSDGHDMDHYADDLAAVTAHLDLHDAVHVGHSTGGGEVAHYIARHGEDRVAKAGRQPVRVLPGFALGTLLRLQPARRRALRSDHRQLVAPGDDGGSEGTLRRHRRLLPD